MKFSYQKITAIASVCCEQRLVLSEFSPTESEKTMKPYSDVLQSLGACQDAVVARQGMTVEEAMQVTVRADWLLWLAIRLALDDRKIVLATARCVKTILAEMPDARSRKAVEVAEKYGLDKASLAEVHEAYYAAVAADSQQGHFCHRTAAAVYTACAASHIDYAISAITHSFSCNVNRPAMASIVLDVLKDDIVQAVNKLAA